MAQSGMDSLSSTLAGGHDYMFDYCCDLCERDGLQKEAVGFCADCQDYLCTECFSTHLRPKPSRRHVLLDQNQMPKDQQQHRGGDTCTEACPTHPHKTVEYFCNQHDELGCSVCMTLNHRTCTGVEHIPDIASDILNSEEYVEVQNEATFLTHVANTAIQTSLDQSKSSKIVHANVLEDFKQFKKALGKAVDRIEKDIIKKADKINGDDEKKMKLLENKYKDILKDIQALISKLTSLQNNGQFCQLFIAIKRAKRDIHTIETSIGNPELNMKARSYRLITSSEVQLFIDAPETMVKLEVEDEAQPGSNLTETATSDDLTRQPHTRIHRGGVFSPKHKTLTATLQGGDPSVTQLTIPTAQGPATEQLDREGNTPTARQQGGDPSDSQHKIYTALEPEAVQHGREGNTPTARQQGGDPSDSQHNIPATPGPAVLPNDSEGKTTTARQRGWDIFDSQPNISAIAGPAAVQHDREGKTPTAIQQGVGPSDSQYKIPPTPGPAAVQHDREGKTPTASQQGVGPSDSQYKIPATPGPAAVQHDREGKTPTAGQQRVGPSDSQYKIPPTPGPAAVQHDREGKTPTAGQQGVGPSDSQYKIPATPGHAAVQHDREGKTPTAIQQGVGPSDSQYNIPPTPGPAAVQYDREGKTPTACEQGVGPSDSQYKIPATPGPAAVQHDREGKTPTSIQQGVGPSDSKYKIPPTPGPAAVQHDREGKTPTAGQQGVGPSDSQYKIPATPGPAAVQHDREGKTPTACEQGVGPSDSQYKIPATPGPAAVQHDREGKTPTASQQGVGPSDSKYKIPPTPGPAAVQHDREVKTPTVSQQGAEHSVSQHTIPTTPGPAALQHGGEIKKTRTYHVMDIQVRSTDDNNRPIIIGCVLLPNAKLVVVDSNNDSVKLVDLTHNSVVSQLKLGGETRDVTHVNSTQVATTSYNTETISFVAINANRLIINHKVKVNGQCRGIASIDDKLVVSYDKPVKVEIISMEGKVLHTVISEDKGGEIFTSPKSVAVSKNLQVIYISDRLTGTVTSVDLTGQVLATYNDDKLQRPRGLTVDSEGRVYVCGDGSNNILQLTADLTEIQELIQQSDGVGCPMSVYYCEVTDRLYIGLFDSDVMKVFQLK